MEESIKALKPKKASRKKNNENKWEDIDNPHISSEGDESGLLPDANNTNLLNLKKKLSSLQDEKLLIILGAKDSDISKIVANLSDINLFIPPKFNDKLVNKHPFNIIEEISLGVEASILLIISHLVSWIISFLN